ncbi:MAG: SPOR domain-containing protein [Bacteroidota bacterium]|nr:SPOR domain-containing protein [Bacteroidota bacterium]
MITFISGCKTGEEIKKEERVEDEVNEFLAKYEKTFDPAEYDEDVDKILQMVKRQKDIIEAEKIFKISPAETIQGFRLQVLFTPDIQHANRLRDELTDRLSDTWTYIVYDAPYYKIRVGNYLDRTSAAAMMKKLNGMGYKDAWIVPDKIIKNPPPRPPDTLIEAERKPYPR